MNIAVLSGKGGTGKTTISTNLALALDTNYVDCDVEEPNGFLFLNPQIENIQKVMVEYPVIDKSTCVACGECAKICQFNALIKILKDVVLFEKLCHSCGACKIACKTGALKYELRETGIIEKGRVGDIYGFRGMLHIGEPMAVSVIKQLLKTLPKSNNLIDCSPGTSCNVVHTLKHVDGAILVTEPSQFGLHDLKMAVELVRLFDIPFGVAINKDDMKQNIIRDYCSKEDIHIIGSIPYSRDIANIYSKGNILYYYNDQYRIMFDELSKKVKEVLEWS